MGLSGSCFLPAPPSLPWSLPLPHPALVTSATSHRARVSSLVCSVAQVHYYGASWVVYTCTCIESRVAVLAIHCMQSAGLGYGTGCLAKGISYTV